MLTSYYCPVILSAQGGTGFSNYLIKPIDMGLFYELIDKYPGL